MRMITPETHARIVAQLRNSKNRGSELRLEAMQALDSLPTYDWSGIYILNGGLLHLAEYVGAATDHTEIPVGRGVCGTAVKENANQVIDDVRELSNYLSCSIQTRSEIVVLIRDSEGTILGQIDIDGHTVGAFDETDEALLNEIAEVLAAAW